MRMGLVVIGALLCGCSQQEQAQRALMERMDGGLMELSQWQGERQEVLEDFYRQRRGMLDDAFDADVKSPVALPLEPEWVIEHRKAYVAALEAMWKQESASAQANAQADRNLEALRHGL